MNSSGNHEHHEEKKRVEIEQFFGMNNLHMNALVLQERYLSLLEITYLRGRPLFKDNFYLFLFYLTIIVS